MKLRSRLKWGTNRPKIVLRVKLVKTGKSKQLPNVTKRDDGVVCSPRIGCAITARVSLGCKELFVRFFLNSLQ